MICRFLHQQQARFRLVELLTLRPEDPDDTDLKNERFDFESRGELKELSDRLGSAGFLGRAARAEAKRKCFLFIGIPMFVIAMILLPRTGSTSEFLFALLLCIVSGLWFGLSAWLFYLKYRTQNFERELLFRTPLFLESLVLVVESGVGILPALRIVLSHRTPASEIDPVRRIFLLVYRLAENGLPFDQALELLARNLRVRVLQHVLLHLDISANAGGELIPSLRSLSDQTHREWRLSVEQRVRRLESLVVFPVFISVMGLVLVTAAVPIVPLLNLKGTLESKAKTPSEQNSGIMR